MTPNEISDFIKKIEDFQKATPEIYAQYRSWRLETDLEFITVRGKELPVKFVTYPQYFEWRLGLDELNQVQIEQSDLEFTEYEEVT